MTINGYGKACGEDGRGPNTMVQVAMPLALGLDCDCVSGIDTKTGKENSSNFVQK